MVKNFSTHHETNSFPWKCCESCSSYCCKAMLWIVIHSKFRSANKKLVSNEQNHSDVSVSAVAAHANI